MKGGMEIVPMRKTDERNQIVREQEQLRGHPLWVDRVSSFSPSRSLTTKFSAAVSKTLQSLGLIQFCSSSCSKCGRPVRPKRIQYSKNDVLQVFESIQKTGRVYPLPRPYCRKCIHRLGVEPYSWI